MAETEDWMTKAEANAQFRSQLIKICSSKDSTKLERILDKYRDEWQQMYGHEYTEELMGDFVEDYHITGLDVEYVSLVLYTVASMVPSHLRFNCLKYFFSILNIFV